jgi:hypothetical protein
MTGAAGDRRFFKRKKRVTKRNIELPFLNFIHMALWITYCI